MGKTTSLQRIENQSSALSVSADEIAYLRSLSENEKVTLAALQATRHSYERHLAQKYSLQQGDQITTEGGIVRAKKDEPVKD